MLWVHRFCAVVLGVAFATSGAIASAKPVDPSEIKNRTELTPKRLVGVDVEEKLSAPVPGALAFETEAGETVLYDQLVRGPVPTILTFNYSDCPMLCSLQLNALVDSMKQLDLTLGKDYRIVTVSLDPKETAERARGMKNRYLAQYGRPEASPEGWTFLHGSESNIRAVTRALGFSYNYNEARDEYIHPAAFAITTPDGVVARYLYGLEYHPRTLRLSLVEASEGKIGSSMDRLILFCFHYDASEGRYAPMAMNIMRLAGGSGALALGALLSVLWWNERRKKASPPAPPGSPPGLSGRPPLPSAP